MNLSGINSGPGCFMHDRAENGAENIKVRNCCQLKVRNGKGDRNEQS